MKPTMPWLASPASPIFSFAVAAALEVGLPSKPEPGLTRLPASRPSPSAMTVATKK